jgi:uncharacterized membrane protein YciS (DUF1049 family)
VKGDYSVEFLRANWPSAVLDEYSCSEEIFAALDDGRLFAFVDDVPRAVIGLQTSKASLGEFRSAQALYSKELNFGVRKGRSDLLAFIKAGMDEIDDGERQTLAKQWIPYVQSELGFRLSWAIAMYIAVGATLSFFIGAFFVLKARVHAKTSQLTRTLSDRDRLIAELKESIAREKRLIGLIPICANCKKIRNDKGYWEQVEIYVREHSDARFSHGICPECAQALYGDILGKDALDNMK